MIHMLTCSVFFNIWKQTMTLRWHFAHLPFILEDWMYELSVSFGLEKSNLREWNTQTLGYRGTQTKSWYTPSLL